MPALKVRVLEENILTETRNDAFVITAKKLSLGKIEADVRYIIVPRNEYESMELRFPSQICTMRAHNKHISEISLPGDGPYRCTQEEQYGLLWESANIDRLQSHQRLKKADGLWKTVYRSLMTHPVKKSLEEHMKKELSEGSTIAVIGKHGATKNQTKITEELLQYRSMPDPLDILLKSMR